MAPPSRVFAQTRGGPAAPALGSGPQPMAQTGPRPWPEPSDLVDEEKPVASSAKVKVSATGSGSLIPELSTMHVSKPGGGGVSAPSKLF